MRSCAGMPVPVDGSSSCFYQKTCLLTASAGTRIPRNSMNKNREKKFHYPFQRRFSFAACTYISWPPLVNPTGPFLPFRPFCQESAFDSLQNALPPHAHEVCFWSFSLLRHQPKVALGQHKPLASVQRYNEHAVKNVCIGRMGTEQTQTTVLTQQHCRWAVLSCPYISQVQSAQEALGGKGKAKGGVRGRKKWGRGRAPHWLVRPGTEEEPGYSH